MAETALQRRIGRARCLVRHGVQRLDPQGKPFDPELHQAMAQQPAPEGVEPGTAMPNLGVTEEEARNIAAFLYHEPTWQDLLDPRS